MSELLIYLVVGIGIPALLVASIALRDWVLHHHQPHYPSHA